MSCLSISELPAAEQAELLHSNVVSLGERRLQASAVVAKQLHDDMIIRSALVKRCAHCTASVIETAMLHAIRARGQGLSLETATRLGEAIAAELTREREGLAAVDAAFGDGPDAA
jgi:hypothetical protein